MNKEFKFEFHVKPLEHIDHRTSAFWNGAQHTTNCYVYDFKHEKRELLRGIAQLALQLPSLFPQVCPLFALLLFTIFSILLNYPPIRNRTGFHAIFWFLLLVPIQFHYPFGFPILFCRISEIFCKTSIICSSFLLSR